MAQNMEGTTLRVGDLITLRQSKPYDGWLTAEEFLGDCFVKRPITCIEDSLWEVQVQQQYICSQEYDHMFSESMQRQFSPEEMARLYEFQDAAENEEYLNKKLMALKIGKPVVFGDVIQLQHKKSQKLLTVSSIALAKTERENMKVQITPLGDVNSWLEVIPRYKYDHEGQFIPNGAEFFLRVRERSSEFIHVAKKGILSDDSVREVNSSLDSTSWTLGIFQHAVPKTDKNIFCGYLISLQDIELSSYITLPDRFAPNCDVIASPPTRLSFVATDCNIGTGVLWMIEQKRFYAGGMVDAYMSVSLRHFNSGLFMKLNHGIVTAVADRADATYFDFVISQSVDIGSTLQEGCSVQLNYQGNWLSMLRTGSERKFISSKDKTQAIQLVVSSRALRLFDSDLFVCKECNRRMKIFENMVTANVLRGSVNTDYIIRSLFSVLEHLDEFLNPDDATVSRSFSRMGISAPFVTARNELCIMRQTILREQGGLNGIIQLLKCYHDNQIPEDIAFDRKHLSILGQVGATDLNRIKPKKRVVEAKEAVQPVSSSKQKFAGAARSVAAIQMMKKASEANLIDAAAASTDNSKDNNSDDGDDVKRDIGGILTVAKFIGGFKRNKKPSAQTPNTNESVASDSQKSIEHVPRFLFRNVGLSLRGMIQVGSANMKKNDKPVNDGNQGHAHDTAEDKQLQALDSMHASLGAYLAHFCLKVLLSSLMNNRPNQMHLADSLDIILSQVMHNPVAVLCVQNMLQGNLLMLQNKIKDREIQLFLDLVRDNSMNATFIKLLQNTCVCPMGIDATQRIISISLFGDNSSNQAATDLSQFTTVNNAHNVLLNRAKGQRNSITLAKDANPMKPVIISLSTDNRAIHKAVWVESNLYFPSSEEHIGTVLGYDVVSRGVPKLYILWNEQEGYKMYNLFGYHSRIPIETLCAVLRAANKDSLNHIVTGAAAGERKISISPANARKASNNARNLRKQSVAVKGQVPEMHNATQQKEAKKREVVAYFVAQLYLAGALCFDRNYVAIRILESHYSYENLLSVLQSKTVVNEIKAPVCSLLHSLYIDREPQVAIKFPRLVRTSVSLGGGDENELNPQPFKFAVMQHIISDFVRTELDISSCDELSNEMMNLLASLMTFGFYSTTEQLADVINPLLQALENHRVANILKSDVDNQILTPRKSFELTNMSVKSKSKKQISASIRASAEGVSVKRRVTPAQDKNNHESWFKSPVSFIKSLFGIANPSTDAAAKKSIEGSMRYDGPSVTSMHARGSAAVSGDRRSVLGAAIPAHTVNRVVAGDSNSLDDRRSSLTLVSANPENIAATTISEKQKRAVTAGVTERFALETYILDRMQSNSALCLVLSLVIATTVLSIINIIDSIKFSETGVQAYFILDIIVSVIFMVDLAIRYVCVTRINSDFTAFFYDIFNVLDTSIVAMDIVLLSMGGFASSSFAFTKGLKTIRFARVTRVIRAARILNKIAKKSGLPEVWVPPQRYSYIEPMEAATVTGILRVIKLTKQRIQDRQLGSILKSFVTWYDDSNNKIQCNPYDAYKDAVGKDSGEDLIPEKKFDDILLDAIMHSDTTLVTEALYMLMVHKSQDRLLLEATSRIQIISKPEVEERYKIIVSKLRSLRNTAETFEIWGELSKENDIITAKGMVESLNLLLSYVKVQSQGRIIEAEAQIYPDVEMQQLLVNLDALTTLMMIQEALTAETSKSTPIILEIVRTCNELICWFVMWNPDNQALAFKYLNWFIGKIDCDVGSSSVIKSILWSNRVLIKEFPKSLIATCAQKVIENGQNPAYLDILIGLTHVADTGDSGVLNIRNEIAKVITNVERLGIFSMWCAAPGSSAYQERRAAMGPLLEVFPSPEDNELPRELLYHVNYIQLLSGCKLGPKLQAIYQVDDIVAAIVDKDTIYNVRAALGLLLKQTLEQYAENLDISESMWLFVEFTLQRIYMLKANISTTSKLSNPRYRFEIAQWIQLSLDIISCFFDYFGIASFTQALAYDTEVYFVQTKRAVPEVQHIINELALALEDLTGNRFLGPKLKNYISVAASSVNRHADEETLRQLQMQQSTDFKTTDSRRARIMRPGSVSSEIMQAAYRIKFTEYVGIISSHFGDSELYSLAIDMIENIPSVDDHVLSDVRLEPLILKLMVHIKSQLKTSVMDRTLEKVTSETTLWLLKTLRLMIEKNMGYTVKTICDPCFYCPPESPRVVYLQNTLNSSGVTEMCLDLISVGIDPLICVQAAELLVCLLSRAGGNLQCQTTVYSYLSLTDSSLFFEQLKEMIEQQVLWCQRNAESGDSDFGKTVVLPDQIVIMKLIQLICEGNYQANKNLIREQDGNIRFVNILGSMVEYVKVLSRTESLGCTQAAVRVTNTIVILMQGPCVGNQEYFVLHSDLLAALNRLLRTSRPAADSSEEWDFNIELLKENIIDTLRACIEAQRHGSAVMERVESVTEVNVLNVLILSAEAITDSKYALSSLQTKYLAFLPTLSEDRDYAPHIKKKLDDVIASIEVVWDGAIHHIYFDVPEITKGISDAKRENLVTAIEGANQDEKLKDFMKRSSDMYIEVMHTELLQKNGIHGILLWENRVAWMLFWNALVINCLFIRFYEIDPHTDEIVDPPPSVKSAIYYLSILQTFMCCLTLFFIITVKLPVRYKIARVAKRTKLYSVYVAITEPLLMWYLIHLLIVLTSFYYFRHLILSLLLLDFIVLDSTNKTILYAVYIPARLLITNIIVTLIFLHVGACVVFIWYRDQYLHFEVVTMWESFRISVSYGLRLVEGLGQIMYEVTDDRTVFDIIMFFTVVVLLRNIFFGIIIDTFGELREMKAEKEADAANRCFICGIDRFEYDKRVPHGSINFMVHRETVHNMWNYLYFAIKIWRQPRDHDSGIEVYVRKCISEGDVSWIPIGRIGVLEQDQLDMPSAKPAMSMQDSIEISKKSSRAAIEHPRKSVDNDDDTDNVGFDIEMQFGIITEKLAKLANAPEMYQGVNTQAVNTQPSMGTQSEEDQRSNLSSLVNSITPSPRNQKFNFPSVADLLLADEIKEFPLSQASPANLHGLVQEQVRRELSEVHNYVQKLKVMLASITAEIGRLESTASANEVQGKITEPGSIAMRVSEPKPRSFAVHNFDSFQQVPELSENSEYSNFIPSNSLVSDERPTYGPQPSNSPLVLSSSKLNKIAAGAKLPPISLQSFAENNPSDP